MHGLSYLTGIALLLGAASTTGCLMAGNYHSAKTLGQGESSLGLSFSATTYEFNDDDTGDKVSVTIPSLLPEITYHIGMTDNLEVGGRVGIAQLAIEGDIKYRLFHNDKLHLAMAPALGAQSLIFISGTFVRLPVIATYELSDNIAVTGALFAQSSSYTDGDASNEDEDEDRLEAFSGSLVATGGAIGIELSGHTFAIRPSVEFSRYALSLGDDNFDPFNTVNFVIHLAFIGGREKKQLDRIEQKLDAMSGSGAR